MTAELRESPLAACGAAASVGSLAVAILVVLLGNLPASTLRRPAEVGPLLVLLLSPAFTLGAGIIPRLIWRSSWMTAIVLSYFLAGLSGGVTGWMVGAFVPAATETVAENIKIGIAVSTVLLLSATLLESVKAGLGRYEGPDKSEMFMPVLMMTIFFWILPVGAASSSAAGVMLSLLWR